MILFIFLTTMLSLLLIVCGFMADALGSYPWFDKLYCIGWGGFLVVILVSIGLAIIKMLEAAAPYFQEKINHAKGQSGAGTVEEPDKGRRRFLRYTLNSGLIASTSLLVFHGVSQATCLPRVKQVDVGIDNLPPDLEGLSIVLITDLHISGTIRRDFVHNLVQRINHLEPDIIALTGDIVDGTCDDLAYDAAPLAGLASKHGAFCVTGNHEYWYGANEWMREMKKLGFTILMNEHRLVKQGRGRVLVGGVADYSAPSRSDHDSSPIQALKGAPAADVKILLAHQPRSVFEAAEAGFDLQLSGHTHGGQIALGGWLPWPYLGQPFLTGLHKYENTQIYVSNGAGYWGPPLRIGAPSEISLIKLTRAETRPVLAK